MQSASACVSLQQKANKCFIVLSDTLPNKENEVLRETLDAHCYVCMYVCATNAYEEEARHAYLHHLIML